MNLLSLSMGAAGEADHLVAYLASVAGDDRHDLWARILVRTKPRTMIEVGVWEGEFASATLRAVPSIKRYFMLDPWRHLADWNKPLNVEQARFDLAFATAMQRTDFAANRRVVVRGTTTETVKQVPSGLDVAYIDGDHTLRGISIDLILTADKVRPGGLIAGDDFSPTIWQHDSSFEPTMVFPFAVHFAEARGWPIVALPFNQFAIVKLPPGQRAFRFVRAPGAYDSLDVGLQAMPRA